MTWILFLFLQISSACLNFSSAVNDRQLRSENWSVVLEEPPEIGLNPLYAELQSVRWSMRLDADTQRLARIVAWPMASPQIASGFSMTMPPSSARGATNILLYEAPAQLPFYNPLTLPQCLPDIPGWVPVFLQPNPILAHSGIWQRRVDGRTMRAIVVFDGRCGELEQGHSRYVIVASGPTLWRYVEVRPGFHEGPSIAFASEAAAGDVLTLAVTNLPRDMFLAVYPAPAR